MPPRKTDWLSFFTVPKASAVEVIPKLAKKLVGGANTPAASGGEVTQAAHFEMRSSEPMPHGLLDASIFGPDGKRPGHVSLPEPLVHPQLRPRIAEILGFTEEDVRRVARYDTCILDGKALDPEALASVSDYDLILENGGAKALRRCLIERGAPGNLVLDHLLILPLAQRPLERGDGGDLIPSRVGVLYERLLRCIQIAKRYVELDAICQMIMANWENVQETFDQLCYAIAGAGAPPPAPIALDDTWLERAATSWSEATAGAVGTPEAVLERTRKALIPTRPRPRFPLCSHYLDPLAPIDCRFVGESTLLLCLGYSTVAIDLRTEALISAATVPSTSVLAVLPDGQHAMFVARGDVLPSVHVLDVTTGSWLLEWGDLTPPPFPLGAYKSTEWLVYDYGRRLAIPAGREGNGKAGAVLSPCNRYAWIEQDSVIVRVEDMHPQFDLMSLPLRMDTPAFPYFRLSEKPHARKDDDWRVWTPSDEKAFEEPDPTEEPSDDELDDFDQRFALALGPGAFRVFCQGSLYVRHRETLRATKPFSSVCLDSTGQRLALGRPGEVDIVTLDLDGKPVSSKTISLLPFEDTLSLRKIRGKVDGLTRDWEMDLLARFGTASVIREAPLDLLLKPAPFAPADEADLTPMDPALAEAIQAALRAVE